MTPVTDQAASKGGGRVSGVLKSIVAHQARGAPTDATEAISHGGPCVNRQVRILVFLNGARVKLAWASVEFSIRVFNKVWQGV